MTVQLTQLCRISLSKAQQLIRASSICHLNQLIQDKSGPNLQLLQPQLLPLFLKLNFQIIILVILPISLVVFLVLFKITNKLLFKISDLFRRKVIRIAIHSRKNHHHLKIHRKGLILTLL